MLVLTCSGEDEYLRDFVDCEIVVFVFAGSGSGEVEGDLIVLLTGVFTVSFLTGSGDVEGDLRLIGVLVFFSSGSGVVDNLVGFLNVDFLGISSSEELLGRSLFLEGGVNFLYGEVLLLVAILPETGALRMLDLVSDSLSALEMGISFWDVLDDI